MISHIQVLDGNIDDGLSDARSLAASMRGGGAPEEDKVIFYAIHINLIFFDLTKFGSKPAGNKLPLKISRIWKELNLFSYSF